MQEYLNLIDAGYDLAGHDDDFIRRLMRGHAEHQGRNAENHMLRRLATTGQTPEYLFFGDDTTPIPNIFKSPPGAAFLGNCPGGIVVSPSALAPGADSAFLPPLTVQAVAHYGVGALGAKNVLIVSSNNSPILPYFMGKKKSTGPFMDNWRSVWWPVRASLERMPEYTAGNWKKKARLAVTVLAQLNADRVRASLEWLGTNADFQVLPAVFEDNKKLITFRMGDHPGSYTTGNVIDNISVSRHDKGQRRALGCSCCDSRASHTHLYCAEPGEFRETYSIAGILPDYRTALATGGPNSSWLQVEMAEAEGCLRYVTTGHTKCGGVHALVKWSQKGSVPSDPYLAAWLRQAKPVVDEVVRFAENNGFGDDEQKICRLAEMHVTQWSATNMKRYLSRDDGPDLPAKSQVLANYVDIETREVYPLPLLNEADSPQESVAKTYRLVEDFYNKDESGKSLLMTLAGFYNICAKVERARLHDNLRTIFDQQTLGDPK